MEWRKVVRMEYKGGDYARGGWGWGRTVHGSVVLLSAFVPAKLSSISRCRLIKSSSRTPRLDISSMTWWLRKTDWARDPWMTSRRRWSLSNLRMLGRKCAVFPGRVGSRVRTPLQPANLTWKADGTTDHPSFRETCKNRVWLDIVSYPDLNILALDGRSGYTISMTF